MRDRIWLLSTFLYAPPMVKRVRLALGLVVGCGLAVSAGCDSGSDGERKDLEAFAKTALADAEAEIKKEAEEAAREKARLEVEEKKAKEIADHKAAVDALATMPETLPKTLDAACDEVLEAYTEFIKQTYADDAKELMLFYDNKRKRLGERRTKCEAVASIKAAACEAAALRAAVATPEDAAKWRDQGLEIMSHCVDKFEPDAARRIAEAEHEAREDKPSTPQAAPGGEAAGQAG